MPDGSPVLDYLVDLKAHLSVGPPVMFVVNSTQLDYSDPAVQNALCGGEGCNQDSLQAQVSIIVKLFHQNTVLGGNFFRRFCCMFSKSSPLL